MKELGCSPKKRLLLVFVLLNFVINLIASAILWMVSIILYYAGVFSIEHRTPAGFMIAILIYTLSHLIGCTLIAALASRKTLDPANKLIEAMNELAKGNFGQRLDLGGRRLSGNVADSFNRLAEELENTEMLRSDFINNFSHEFKTPIVSILGFSRLLKRGCVSQEEQREYLEIIEEESLRLSQMATNVLNMTKIENQTILTDKSTFDLSEQLRSCLLLLEKKWSAKNITLGVDFDEYEITANEEMLKQVWINLLDNAVKFTPENGEISVEITQTDKATTVSVCNTGEKIPEDDIGRIFRKFYQSDTSHSAEGTGLGLAIAKKIVGLHGGGISVKSDDVRTAFTVELPR